MTHEHDWQLDYQAHAYWCACGVNMTLEQLMTVYKEAERNMLLAKRNGEYADEMMADLAAAQERIEELETENKALRNHIDDRDLEIYARDQYIKKLEEALKKANNYLYSILPNTWLGNTLYIEIDTDKVIAVGKCLDAALETSEDGKAGDE